MGISSLMRPVQKSNATLEEIVFPIEKPVTTNSSAVTFSCNCCNKNNNGPWDLAVQNVDKVLNEVGLYLISDGITVAVKYVNVSTWNG